MVSFRSVPCPVNRARGRRDVLRFAAAQALLARASGSALAASGSAGISARTLSVDGVRLHYTDSGKGTPVVFVHGVLDDYRLWAPQVKTFAMQHRVITYSRRYDWPNHNGVAANDYSAAVDAADLSALMRTLSLESVHLVGHSYGGFVALWAALEQPTRIRTLTLAEPAVFSLLLQDPGGRAAYEDAMNAMWRPAARLFRQRNDEQALGPIVDWFSGRGAFARMSNQERRRLLENLEEWKALTLSTRPFPEVSVDAIRQLRMPVLLMTGSATKDVFRRIDAVLGTELRHVSHVQIAGATHDMWTEQPRVCGEVVRAFIG